ncbi:MAG: hypothetical protein ABI594_14800 [Ginsengibacter sp.]
MYLIEPYKSIGILNLNMSTSEIEDILGNGNIKHSTYLPAIDIGNYINGIKIEYEKNLACYIGVLTSLTPVHLDFNFYDKSYLEVMQYFKRYQGNIYVEDEVSIVSDFLGISAYFEDGIKEVSIFTRSYGVEPIKGLEIII